jgi:SsrA-binding protein
MRAMAKKSKAKKTSDGTIALNKRAKFEYHIETRFEAGVQLQGWEVKSLREGKANITDSYVLIRNGEAFLVAAHISPLLTASTHVVCEPMRPRKLLLHKKEIAKLFAASTQKGHTIVALAMYWKGPHVKVEIALVKGKQLHDKRATEKERDWNKQKHRVLMKAK